MPDISKSLFEAAKKRVESLKKIKPLEGYLCLKEIPAENPFAFERALSGKGLKVIAEIKRASPSAGVITDDFNPALIAKQYCEGGASAISVLTEPERFLGNDEYIGQVRTACRLPVLRKDFTVDPYQIFQARALGADAVLLIVSLLTVRELKDFITLCGELGLSALAETRSKEEIDLAADCGAKIIGVNNRDLTDFSVDLSKAERLVKYVPRGAIFVAESGIESGADLVRLQSAGVNAALIGSGLMRKSDRAAALKEMVKDL